MFQDAFDQSNGELLKVVVDDDDGDMKHNPIYKNTYETLRPEGVFLIKKRRKKTGCAFSKKIVEVI